MFLYFKVELLKNTMAREELFSVNLSRSAKKSADH